MKLLQDRSNLSTINKPQENVYIFPAEPILNLEALSKDWRLIPIFPAPTALDYQLARGRNRFIFIA